MSSKSINTKQLIQLANLPIKDESKVTASLEENVASTIDYVSQISQADTKDTPETHHVTGLSNIFRPDTIDSDRILTQEQALANAKQTHQGYFVVKAVIET